MEMFADVKSTLKDIKTQTTTTNGRVGKLENLRFFITGAISVLTVIVVPLLAWALWVLSNIQGQVHGAVDQALSAYNIKAQ